MLDHLQTSFAPELPVISGLKSSKETPGTFDSMTFYQSMFFNCKYFFSIRKFYDSFGLLKKKEEDNMLKGFDKNILGKRITEERKRRGMKKYHLAEKTGISPSSISQIEHGLRNPTIPVLSRIAEAFSVSIDYLIGKSEKPELEDLLQQEEIQTFFRGFQALEPQDQEVIIKQIDFLRFRRREIE